MAKALAVNSLATEHNEICCWIHVAEAILCYPQKSMKYLGDLIRGNAYPFVLSGSEEVGTIGLALGYRNLNECMSSEKHKKAQQQELTTILLMLINSLNILLIAFLRNSSLASFPLKTHALKHAEAFYKKQEKFESVFSLVNSLQRYNNKNHHAIALRATTSERDNKNKESPASKTQSEKLSGTLVFTEIQ
uniref:Uncharacterized protein n=1 Tax=Glossina austeni TaxID=7395 RepID=A0A1A9VST4_GLOAU